MEKFWEKTFSYIEKVLSPYQVWLIILIVSGGLLFCPEALQTKLSLQDIISQFKGYIVIAFFVSSIVLFIKTSQTLFYFVMTYQGVNSSNLNDEEKAVLYFFVFNQFEGASLKERHPTIISLKNRNFITVPQSPIYVIGSEYDYFIPTKSGKKKLSSVRFQNKNFSELNQEKVLTFINSISREQYSLHTSQSLR